MLACSILARVMLQRVSCLAIGPLTGYYCSLQANKASQAVQHAAGVTEHAKQEVRAFVL